MIKVSIQDFDIISQYKLTCRHCGKVIFFDDHPIDIVNIYCPVCQTEYFLEEEHKSTDFCKCGQVKHVGFDTCIDCIKAIKLEH